ncbi:hypothetical protein [Haloferula sp.]|uniref:hypothetical protein n=1 Tax=Haloferula sp. TaxID=2497595 RepID=UPI00329F3950
MRFDCPSCNDGIEVEARYIGKIANCPHCDDEVKVPMVPGEPPTAALKVAAGEELPKVTWGRLPWRESASVANALRILLLLVAGVIAVLLFRIERQLATIPRMSDIYAEKGELVPHGVTDAESQAPVIHVGTKVRVENGAEVKIGNLAEEPVPVKIRE